MGGIRQTIHRWQHGDDYRGKEANGVANTLASDAFPDSIRNSHNLMPFMPIADTKDRRHRMERTPTPGGIAA